MLQSSNPAGCIPDSLGTQSPWRKDRPSQALAEQHPNISPQLRAANAAALQDLMTQVDPSEADLDAEDVPSDPAGDVDMQEDLIQSSPQPVDALKKASASHIAAANDSTPQPAAAALKECHLDAGRGAGTPAGPLEEFYSPEEHLQPDSLEASADVTAIPSVATAEHVTAAAVPDPEVTALATAETDVAGPITGATSTFTAATAEATAAPAATQAKTPNPAMQTKTPANGKHRLANTR